MACMGNIQCAAVDFQHSTKQCKVYYSTIRSNGMLTADPDFITMIVTVDERRRPGKGEIDA